MSNIKNSLTIEDIKNCIETELVYDLGKKTTAVLLILKNGFEIVGTSGCVDEKNYSQEIGKKYARERALTQVWQLEGYKLQSLLK
jgi:hypothetical protein